MSQKVNENCVIRHNLWAFSSATLDPCKVGLREGSQVWISRAKPPV